VATAVKFTEDELKFLLAAGNTNAFKTLFDRHYKQLVYFAGKFTGDSAEAEDIVMEVFARFWQKRSESAAIANLSSFLFSSVKNACIDFLRKEARHPMLLQNISTELLNDETVIEGEEVFSRLVHQIYESIETLPDQCRTIFKLIYIEGKSTKEVAETLNLSIQTVRNQKTRGLSLIRAKITPPQLLPLALLQLAILYTQSIQ
jgi:RNA polymerase sigma-70 factor (ECF subfamily)